MGSRRVREGRAAARPGHGMNRRAFGRAASAALATGLSATGAAGAAAPAAANSAVYHFAVGEIRATVLSDGQMTFPAWPAYAPDVERAVVEAAMRRRHLAPPDYRLDANVLLLEIDGRRVLVDTGWGAFAPPVGRLSSALAAIGVAPEEIDLVLLSHIHPDHVGGLRDEAGEQRFARADIVVGAREAAQWRDGPDFGAMTIDESFRPVFAEAARLVLERGSRLRLAGEGEEVLPGLSLIALPGHTRGHCGVRIRSGADELIYAADCFHEQAFDLDHPHWRTAFDHDPGRAAETRIGLLERAAADGTALMAFHMPFPGLGRIERAAERFLWQPAPWILGG